MLLIILVFTYISLLLIWFILGAILNPTAYLAYSTASATFIMFIKIKIS